MRIGAIASNTFREAVRNKVMHAILGFALTVILCSLGLVRHTLPPDHEATEDLNVIESAVDRASEIVRRIGSITEYRTQAYMDGIQIIDIDESSLQEPDSPPLDE